MLPTNVLLLVAALVTVATANITILEIKNKIDEARRRLASQQIQKIEAPQEVHCTPDHWQAIGKNGICVKPDDLDAKCSDKEVSASRQDCAGFDGAWCCYVPTPKTNFLKVDFKQAASGSNNYGSYSTALPGTTSTTSTSAPSTAPVTVAPVTSSMAPATTTYAPATSAVSTAPVTTVAPVTTTMAPAMTTYAPTTTVAQPTTTVSMVPATTTMAPATTTYAASATTAQMVTTTTISMGPVTTSYASGLAPASSRLSMAEKSMVGRLISNRKRMGLVDLQNESEDLRGLLLGKIKL